MENVASPLIWEVQPNVLQAGRWSATGMSTGSIGATATGTSSRSPPPSAGCAERDIRTYVLRGAALAPTHEANPANCVSEKIAGLHDRTMLARRRSARIEPAVANAPTREELLLASRFDEHWPGDPCR